MEETASNIPGTNGSDTNGSGTPPIPGLGEGQAKRGRGRPPGSTNKNRQIDLGGKAENVSRSNSSNQSDLEGAKFIGESLAALVELGQTIVHNKCEAKVKAKIPHKLAEFLALAEEKKIQPKELAMISDSATRIAARHEWLTKYAPEAVLLVSLGNIGLRQLALVRLVDSVTTDRKQAVETPPPNPPI